MTPMSSPLEDPACRPCQAPPVMPMPNVMSATLRLFVMIALDATGFTATIECVHISRRSMVSTICGPSMLVLKSGSRTVRIRAGDGSALRTGRGATAIGPEIPAECLPETSPARIVKIARGAFAAPLGVDGMVSARQQPGSDSSCVVCRSAIVGAARPGPMRF